MPDALQWVLQKTIFISNKAIKPGKGTATRWFYHVTQVVLCYSELEQCSVSNRSLL